MKQLPDRLTIVALIAFAILSLFAVKRLITTKESPTKTAVPQPVWPSTPADVVPRVRQAHRGPIANPDDTSAQKALKLVTQLVKDGQLDRAARELTRHLSSNWRDHLPFPSPAHVGGVPRDGHSAPEVRTLGIAGRHSYGSDDSATKYR